LRTIGNDLAERIVTEHEANGRYVATAGEFAGHDDGH
jgi:hypothetical protein